MKYYIDFAAKHHIPNLLVDYPAVYKNNPKQFQFVLDIPTIWDETKLVGGAPA